MILSLFLLSLAFGSTVPLMQDIAVRDINLSENPNCPKYSINEKVKITEDSYKIRRY